MNAELILTVAVLALVALAGGIWWHFQEVTPEQHAARKLKEARLAAMMHREAMEHHRALSNMYTLRVKRIGGALVPVDTQFGELS